MLLEFTVGHKITFTLQKFNNKKPRIQVGRKGGGDLRLHCIGLQPLHPPILELAPTVHLGITAACVIRFFNIADSFSK